MCSREGERHSFEDIMSHNETGTINKDKSLLLGYAQRGFRDRERRTVALATVIDRVTT